MSFIGSAWGQETYTISFNGSIVQTPEGPEFFKCTNVEFNKKYKLNSTSPTYKDVSYESGLKMQKDTEVSFTTTNKSSIIIVQSKWDNNGNYADRVGICLYGVEGETVYKDLSYTQATDINDCYVYTISDVPAGSYAIRREGHPESGLFFVSVTEEAPVLATAISLNPTTAVLQVGKTLTLNATVEPADATTETTWTTSDASVATVENGVVTALKAGVVTITATNNGKSATCTVVVPAVLSVGTTEKTATVANITSFSNCVITRPGQLMDSATDGATVKFQVTPEVSGTYSFTSIISTAWQERSVTLTCGDQTGETKIITPGGWNANDGQSYTWEFDLIKDQTYTITVSTKEHAKDIAEENENGYMVNIYDMDIVMTAAAVTTNTVNAGINHFNYIDGTFPAARNNFLGLNFWFGGSAVVDGYINVKLSTGGSMTIQSANSKNIRKVVFQKVSDERMYTEGSLTSDVNGKFALDDEKN